VVRGVAVEKLAHSEFAKIGSRQEALQTISPSLLDIFYHPIFDFFQKNRLFQQPQDFATSIRTRTQGAAWRAAVSAYPTENLLLRCLSFDLFNHDGLRTASLVDLPASGYLVSSKRQKLRVLPTRWRGIGDRPVNSSVVRENDEL
jgi:hypothetical protein